MPAVRILVIDNYDSFVYNLVQYLAQIGAEVEVCEHDDGSTIRFADGSTGSARQSREPPNKAWVCVEVVRTHGGRLPTLVRLGAAIGVAYRLVDRARSSATAIPRHPHHGIGYLSSAASLSRSRYHSWRSTGEPLRA